MIRLHKMASVARGEHVECETVDAAIEHFTAESAKYLIVRCDFDEEAIGLEQAVFKKNEWAANAAALASVRNPSSCILWQAKANFAEGQGWRTIWCPNVVQPQPQGAPPRARGH